MIPPIQHMNLDFETVSKKQPSKLDTHLYSFCFAISIYHPRSLNLETMKCRWVVNHSQNLKHAKSWMKVDFQNSIVCIQIVEVVRWKTHPLNIYNTTRTVPLGPLVPCCPLHHLHHLHLQDPCCQLPLHLPLHQLYHLHHLHQLDLQDPCCQLPLHLPLHLWVPGDLGDPDPFLDNNKQFCLLNSANTTTSQQCVIVNFFIISNLIYNLIYNL